MSAPGQVQAAQHGAVDVPRLRDALLQSWRGPLLRAVLHAHPDGVRRPHYPGTGRQWPVGDYADWLVDRLAAAELFWVNPDMSEVVRQAAGEAPYYQVTEDEQPADTGFVVWARQVCEVNHDINPDAVDPGERISINAALWARTADVGDGQPGVVLVTLQDTDVLAGTRLGGQWAADVRKVAGPLAYHEEYLLPFGTRPWGEPARRLINAAVAAAQTTWVLMGQRIAAQGRETLPRQQRRALQREGRPEPVVRTVTLRRAAPVQEQQRRPGESGRTYTRQWVVQGYGYWRNTWYPSKGEHRQQWVYVPAYVKGPAGAPLVGGERVNVLRR